LCGAFAHSRTTVIYLQYAAKSFPRQPAGRCPGGIPLVDLASVSQLSVAQLRDISSDLALGIRIESEELTLGG
jgi:hypothetical protein